MLVHFFNMLPQIVGSGEEPRDQALRHGVRNLHGQLEEQRAAGKVEGRGGDDGRAQEGEGRGQRPQAHHRQHHEQGPRHHKQKQDRQLDLVPEEVREPGDKQGGNNLPDDRPQADVSHLVTGLYSAQEKTSVCKS